MIFDTCSFASVFMASFDRSRRILIQMLLDGVPSVEFFNQELRLAKRLGLPEAMAIKPLYDSFAFFAPQAREMTIKNLLESFGQQHNQKREVVDVR